MIKSQLVESASDRDKGGVIRCGTVKVDASWDTDAGIASREQLDIICCLGGKNIVTFVFSLSPCPDLRLLHHHVQSVYPFSRL
jgi:hypothetical protein